MIQVLEIYKKFHCLGPDCPQSCCKGWQIPVEDATFKKYVMLPGAYGRHVRSNVSESRDLHYIKKQFGVCPFVNSDKHCQFQDNGEQELMPIVCRLYPRESLGFNDLVLVTFTLSCAAAAKLLIENLGRLKFEEVDYDVEVLWEMGNDEPDYMRRLITEREKLLDHFWSGDDMPSAWQDMYAHIYAVHDEIMADRIERMSDVPLSSDKSLQGKYALHREPTYAFFPIKTIDRMILEVIDYGSMYIRQHEMYKLIKLYTKCYSKMLVHDADQYFDHNIKKLIEKHPEYGEKYRSYFSYNIQQLILVAYENYHILRQYLFAVLYTELYMIFDLLDYEAHDCTPPDIDRQAFVMALCEHSIRHNPALTENLLRVIRQDFL